MRAVSCSSFGRALFPPIAAAAFACVAWGGCSSVDNQPWPDGIAPLDEASFRCNVEPILIRDCSYTGCHGNAGFPLRVYSLGKLRLGDPQTLELRTRPLTSDERHANFLSAAAFSFDTPPERNLLLMKPMPVSAGGFEHIGGALWEGPDDPRAVVIRKWLEGDAPACRPAPGGTP